MKFIFMSAETIQNTNVHKKKEQNPNRGVLPNFTLEKALLNIGNTSF